MKVFFIYFLKKYLLVYLIYNKLINAHKFMLFRSHKNTIAPNNCNLKLLEQVQPLKPLQSSESTIDVTDEMLRYHQVYTENHGLQPFTIDSNSENKALRWCHIQHHTSCDLVYPLNIAFNAAKVPAFLPMQQVVQFWYNQRKNYNFKKSFVSNIHLAQQGGYEILGYANMISDAFPKHLGCCQTSCDDGISVVYGCVYSPHGAGYWKLGESSQRTKGYVFFIPPSLEDDRNFLSKPRENLVRHLPYEKLIDIGCSSLVPGNGPSTILEPWIFSCPQKENNISVNNTLTDEKKFFFTSTNVVTSGCQQSLETESAPFLLLCPKSCLKEVYNQYDTLTTVEIIDDKEQFALKDSSGSLCGKELLKQNGYNVGPSILFYVTSDSSNGILNNQACSATYETFLDCGSTSLQCFSMLKTPSVTNNWIVDSVETPLLNDVENTFFILRHTMCTSSRLKVQTLPLNRGFGNLGLIGGYLNPLNFILYNIDTAKGEASLFLCSKGQCKRLDRTFLGSVLDLPLHAELVIQAFNTPPIQGKLNGETILSGHLFEKDLGVIGASGLALSHNAHFQFLESIVLLPESSSYFSDSLNQVRNFNNNLLPLWTLGRIKNHTKILDLIKSL